MKEHMEYLKVFMKYEADDMPVVYFYEVDTRRGRYALRAIEVFADRHVRSTDELYRGAIEITPVPTADDLNSGLCGEGFFARVISGQEFDFVWSSGIYGGELSAAPEEDENP